MRCVGVKRLCVCYYSRLRSTRTPAGEREDSSDICIPIDIFCVVDDDVYRMRRSLVSCTMQIRN